MTVLHLTNQVTRETCSYYRQRALVVTLHARHIEIRPKGLRPAEIPTVDYPTLYELALKIQWKRKQAEKLTAKRKRKRLS